MLLRVLTARAVQRVLGQLSETDILVAQWLNNYCSDPKNNPSAGNAFLLGLFGAQGAVVTENHTGTLHTIDPPGLARRIILVSTRCLPAGSGGSCAAATACRAAPPAP